MTNNTINQWYDSIFESKYQEYLKAGYDEEEAEELAFEWAGAMYEINFD